MYTKIVVALDGSTRSPAVLAKAVELAEQAGAELHLVRAMAIPIDLPALTWAFRGDDLGTFLVEHGLQELRLVARQLPEGKVSEIHCRLGKPWEVICEVAKSLEADLIILGSHGYDGIDYLIGTNAGKVVNHAHCSVLVVR
ncbi:MAG: universal stress protein [Myxococcales bacterium]|nr:universal stress protein [Myxococcales bacterium]